MRDRRACSPLGSEKSTRATQQAQQPGKADRAGGFKRVGSAGWAPAPPFSLFSKVSTPSGLLPASSAGRLGLELAPPWVLGMRASCAGAS